MRYTCVVFMFMYDLDVHGWRDGLLSTRGAQQRAREDAVQRVVMSLTFSFI